MIFIDSREPQGDVTAILETMGVEIDRRVLNVNDFIVAGGQPSLEIPSKVLIADPNILIVGEQGEIGIYVAERKSPFDFLASIVSAHLNNQLYNMSTHYKHSALLIEGSLKEAIDASGLELKSAYGALVGAFLRHSGEGEQGSISVFQYDTAWDLALILERMQNKLNDKRGLTRHYMIRLPVVTDDDPVVKAVMCCPGIGEKTARAILKEYPTILHIVVADIKEMAKKVPGVGEITAKTLIRFLSVWRIGQKSLDAIP